MTKLSSETIAILRKAITELSPDKLIRFRA